MACEGNNGTGACALAQVACVPGATGPGIYEGDFFISPEHPENDLEDLAGIHCIAGGLWIYSTALTHLDPLPSLVAIAADLVLYNNDQLANVDGLAQLESIGLNLYIEYNSALLDLTGLSSLQQLGTAEYAGLAIANNAQLPACWVPMIESQTSADCGDVWGDPNYMQCTGNDGVGVCE